MSFARPAAAPPHAPGPSRIIRRIGLWGAPGSGKTTFLAALNVAVLRGGHNWRLFGVDDEATAFLSESTAMLTERREFPPATTNVEHRSWVLMSQAEVRYGPRWRRRTATVPVEFHLDMLDAPGSRFDSQGSGGNGAVKEPIGDRLGFDDEDDEDDAPFHEPLSDDEELIDSLATCDGILYLFDPIREWKVGDAYRYFHRTFLRVAQRAMQSGRLVDTRLPHHLAVCVTKFDEPKVYLTARERGYLTYDMADPYLFPRVHEDAAEDLFRDLCRISATGSAEMVRTSIEKYFLPERVRYFATSAVGFYLGSAARFRGADFQNVVPVKNGKSMIRGEVHPINVVEPLLWLGRHLADTPGVR